VSKETRPKKDTTTRERALVISLFDTFSSILLSSFLTIVRIFGLLLHMDRGKGKRILFPEAIRRFPFLQISAPPAPSSHEDDGKQGKRRHPLQGQVEAE